MPHWVAQRQEWQAWPFLADMARLDWAQHLSLLADKPAFEANTLMLLGQDDADADDLVLQLQPGLQLLQSDWPVVQIDKALDAGMDLKPIVLNHAAENACVLGLNIQSIPPHWYPFMANACANPATAPSLQTLLSAHTDIDFSAWLTTALQQGWLVRIEHRPAH